MKDILIILAAIVVPIVALYLTFAFVAWDFWWPSDCWCFYRVVYVFILAFALLGTIGVACAIIDSMKKRNRYETENPQSPPTALLR